MFQRECWCATIACAQFGHIALLGLHFSNVIFPFNFSGVVLQEEDIGLLTDAFKELVEMLKAKPRVTKASMEFCASLTSSAWVCDFKRGGFPSFSGINRLHMVYELFGEMTVQDAKMTVDSNKREMVATLRTNDM